MSAWPENPRRAFEARHPWTAGVVFVGGIAAILFGGQVLAWALGVGQ